MPVGMIRPMAMGALLVATLAVGGCSTQIADLPAVGLPADAPPRPKEAGSYLPVHDLPPDVHSFPRSSPPREAREPAEEGRAAPPERS